MSTSLKEHGEHPRIKKLDSQGCIDSVVSSEQALTVFATGAESWVPELDLDAQIEALNDAIEQFRLALCSAHRWNKSFSHIDRSAKQVSRKEKRSLRNALDGLTKQLVDSSLPKAVAKAAAVVLKNVAHSTIEEPFVQPELQLDDGRSMKQIFNDPCLVSARDALPDNMKATWFHEEAARVITTNGPLIKGNLEMMKASLVKGKVVAMSTLNKGATFGWNDGGSTTLLNPIPDLVPVWYVHEALRLDSRLEVLPWRGQRNLLSVYSGSCIVILISAEQAMESDVNSFFDEMRVP